MILSFTGHRLDKFEGYGEPIRKQKPWTNLWQHWTQ